MISHQLPTACLAACLVLTIACSAPPGRPAPEPDLAATSGDEGRAGSTDGAEPGDPAQSAEAGDTSPEAQAVVAAWDGYKRALGAREGEAAAALVTPETIAIYDEWRRLALHSTADDLHDREAPARLSALLFRQQVDAGDLAEMDGRQLFATAVAGGWVGSEVPADIRVVRMQDDTAYVNFVQNGQAVPMELPLVRKVEGTWKVDIARLVEITEPQITAVVGQLAQQRGQGEDEALLYIVQSTTGEPASEDLWTPPQPREEGQEEQEEQEEQDEAEGE